MADGMDPRRPQSLACVPHHRHRASQRWMGRHRRSAGLCDLGQPAPAAY